MLLLQKKKKKKTKEAPLFIVTELFFLEEFY